MSSTSKVQFSGTLEGVSLLCRDEGRGWNNSGWMGERSLPRTLQLGCCSALKC